MKISRIMSISKILIDLCAIRQKIELKNTSSDFVWNVSVLKKSCNDIKNGLKINGNKQSVKLKSSLIKLKNYFKQLAVSFKIYADFESVLKGVKINGRSNNTSCTDKNQKHVPCSFAYKVVCIDDKFSKPVVCCRGKNGVNKFIEAILKVNEYCKKMIKKHFNKNLVMSVEDERRPQSSNKCWIFVAGIIK